MLSRRQETLVRAQEPARKMVTCRIKDPGQGFSPAELKHSAIANPAGDPLRHAVVGEEQGYGRGDMGFCWRGN
jgi:hypothetical protein